MLRRLAMIAIAACAIAVTAYGDTAGQAGTPERIEPMRKRMLTPERYRELQREWKVYTEAHPNDPIGWVKLAKASNYAGDSCDVAVRYAEKAYRLGPNNADALATLGGWKWFAWCDGQPVDPSEAIGLLERALRLDPNLDDPHVRLWVMRLSKGQRDAANAEFRGLLDRGRIPEPLTDFGYNLLVGLEHDAILLTNGDNDTVPTIALQAARGLRTDVAVVNLSCLNLGWYRREMRNGRPSVPVPLLEQDPRAKSGSVTAVKGLIEKLARDGWKRPLYVACTVDLKEHPVPNRLSLEGIVYRVLPKPGTGTEVNTSRIARNLNEVYRLESAMSPGLDWEAWSSVSQLMLNYAAADLQFSTALLKSGDLAQARESMVRSLTLGEFHHSTYLPELVKQWSLWDSNSPELKRWKKKLRM